ncbi:MAG: sugar phosphate isomerase/epimerase [Planctomycetes bacterium]|nr:sugar phosphate isomerase/epimerase [Planctomycetota bacterium]
MFKNLSPGAVGIKADFKTNLKLCKDVGFEGLDLNMGAAKQLGPEKVKAMYAEAGLKIGGGVPCPDFRKDEDTFKQAMQGYADSVKLAADCGCTRCATWIMPGSDELPFQENFDTHARRLREVAKVLNDHGIFFGLEFVGPKTSRASKKYEFVWNMPGMLQLCDAIGTPNMGLLLDAWHWHTSGGTADDIKALKGSQVVYVHVNDAPKDVGMDEYIDNQRALPGETGVIDIGTFLRCLNEIGCDGPITSEPFSQALREMPDDEAAKVTIGNLNKIFDVAGL